VTDRSALLADCSELASIAAQSDSFNVRFEKADRLLRVGTGQSARTQ